MDGSRLRLLRVRRGWTQTTLATVSGVDRKTINAHERGQRRRMWPRTHDKITAAFAAFPTIEDQIEATGATLAPPRPG